MYTYIIYHSKTIIWGARWPPSVRFDVRSRKLSNVGQSLDGWPKIYNLELLRASEGTLSHWSRLDLRPLAPTNPHWARVVGYGPFSFCVIHKEGLCSNSGYINRLMMMMIYRSRFIPEGVAETSHIYLRYAHILCMHASFAMYGVKLLII
jgi:hypothetical protein